MERILSDLAGNRDLLNRLRQQGMSYARECLTWDAKAQSHNSGPELGLCGEVRNQTFRGRRWRG